MQNPNDVMTRAFEGHVGEVADEIGVSDKRLYELLGRDNYYPKLWRLLNPLGRINPSRLELVKADFNARCDRILRPHRKRSTPATLHKELSEAINAVLSKAAKDFRKQQILEAIAELQCELEKCEVNE